MTQLNRMNRMISFRLSDEEYCRLSELRLTTKARSLSDLARNAVNFWMENSDSQERNHTISGRLNELEKKVATLSTEFDRLSGDGDEH
jgi:hypothetical protein